GEFIDPAPKGQVEIPIVNDAGQPVREDPRDPTSRVLVRWFLPSTSADNPHLDGSYYARFDMMGATARAAYRDGDWSRFEGMRFDSFNLNVHVVDPSVWPLDLLLPTPRGIGVDYGSSAPFAAVWGARPRDGLVVIYREL